MKFWHLLSAIVVLFLIGAVATVGLYNASQDAEFSAVPVSLATALGAILLMIGLCAVDLDND